MDAWRGEAELMRPKRRFIALGASLYALGLWIVAVTSSAELLSLFGQCALFGTMAIAYAFRSTRGARFRKGSVTIDRDGALTIDGRVVTSRAQLRQGSVAPAEDGKILVRLDRKGMNVPIFLRVREEEQGMALLRCLGFDAEHAAAEMRVASNIQAISVPKQLALFLPPMLLSLLAVVFTALTNPALVQSVLLGMFGPLMAYSFTLGFMPTVVRIGTDGVFTRWFGRQRFFAFGEIASVDVYDEYRSTKRALGVRLTLHDGKTVDLPTGQTNVAADDARRVHHRILEARRAHDAGTALAGSAVKDLLAPGERKPAEWVRDLRRLGAAAHGLRTAAVPVDVLLRIVEDTSAPATDRARAAVAASAHPDAETRTRVRIAAETTAAPTLRETLIRIAEMPADASDEALAETLETLDPENAKTRTA